MSYPSTLLILNECGQILARQNENMLTLPVITVEAGRAGISLSRAVRQQLHLDVFCLVLDESITRGLQVLRTQSPNPTLESGYVWVSPAGMSEQVEITSILAAIDATANVFGGYAWYSKVSLWLEQKSKDLGYALHRLEQWNGRIGGVLLRVLTSGPDFWFKAVSDFNLREASITGLLASRHPLYFPRIVATQPEWNAFLLEHVEGTELYESNDLDTWKGTARRLAELQIAWVGLGGQLLKAGAADLRASALTAKLRGFLDHVEEAMARQPKTPPRRLVRSDLNELGNLLYELSADVDALPISDGLANADFSPHNTLITHRGPVFIDWAEACVSLPLIAGEYMWNRMVVESPDRAQWQSALRGAYLCRWAESYDMAHVQRAAELMPAFSIFAVAMFYHERESHGPSPYDSYLRSLVRKLDAAVKSTPRQDYALEA